MKKSGSIMEMEGCIPQLDHVVTIEERNEGIAEYIRADCARFEAQSRARRIPEITPGDERENSGMNEDCGDAAIS
jgi:hypothetical protein